LKTTSDSIERRRVAEQLVDAREQAQIPMDHRLASDGRTRPQVSNWMGRANRGERSARVLAVLWHLRELPAAPSEMRQGRRKSCNVGLNGTWWYASRSRRIV
jgi:hypothetical protein